MFNDSANDVATRGIDDAPGRVAPLSELDELEVADGYPEVRGWDVQDAAGRSIGYVYDLIVDVDALRVRYLDVELDPEFAGTDADRRVLVPLDAVNLDGGAEGVLLRDVQAADVHTLVPFARRGVAREQDVVVSPAAGVADVGAPMPALESELRRPPHYDDERLFSREREAREREERLTVADEELRLGTRQVGAGSVEVRKTVDTERVSKTVPVVHDEVDIERRPLRPGEVLVDVETRGDEIRIPIMAEELVVEKRLVAKEVLIIRKRTVTEERTVEAEVRREQVHVDDPLGRVRTIGPSGGPEARE